MTPADFNPSEVLDRRIHRMARSCLAKMPQGAGYEVEDLVQEVYAQALEGIESWDEKGGASVSTFVTRRAMWTLCHLLQKEWRRRNNTPSTSHLPPPRRLNPEEIDLDEFSVAGADAELSSNQVSPERLVIVDQAIQAVRDFSRGLAALITVGAPPELVKVIRAENRRLCAAYGRKATNCKVRSNRKILEEYYGVDLDEIKDAVLGHLGV